MDAFVSHSSKDAAFATELVKALEEQGVSCWIAPRNIPVGGDYASAIIEAIKHCACVALVFTREANESPHVLREVERAVAYRRPIVPLRLHEMSPSGSFDYLLATLQWASACGLPAQQAMRIFSDAVRASLEFAAGKGPPTLPHCLRDRGEAHEKLWQFCTEIELGYRRALREDFSEEQWTALDARLIALNEFVIANGRHFLRALRGAAGTLAQCTAALAGELRTQRSSEVAKDFAITAILPRETFDAGMRLAKLMRDFDDAKNEFEQLFEESSLAR